MFVDYNDLRYTNLDARVVIEVHTGLVTVIALQLKDFRNLDNGKFEAPAIHYEAHIQSRHIFDIPTSSFDNNRAERVLFFVHVLCETGEDCDVLIFLISMCSDLIL